jgi:hypothetical protein
MMVVMIVIMVVIMVIVIMVVMIMIMLIVIMIIVIVVVMHVGCHDTRQADWVMWMVGAVTAAIILCRGRSRGKRHSAQTSHGGSSAGD